MQPNGNLHPGRQAVNVQGGIRPYSPRFARHFGKYVRMYPRMYSR